MFVALTSRRVATRVRARRVPLALTAALLAACTDPVTGPETGVVLESEYQLLFVLTTNEVANIYRMNPDGTGREQLTHNDNPYVVYHSMDVSPDGRQVAMHSNALGCPGIRVMNVDGTGFRDPAPDDPWCPRLPRWSRDGQHIGYLSREADSYVAVVVGIDGSGRRNVSAPLHALSEVTSSGAPVTWTPDGRFVFNHATTESQQAYLVNPDGSGLVPLPGPAGGFTPFWSPDGSKVAFLRYREDGQAALHVMNADGSDVRRLTDHAQYDGLPTGLAAHWTVNVHSPWSPDGRHIAFDGPDGMLQVIRPDGSGYRELATGATFGGWSPDGRVTFMLDGDIYLIAPDGSGLVNITATPGEHERNVLWTRRWSDE